MALELSSNWKQLQATLKKITPQSPSFKTTAATSAGKRKQSHLEAHQNKRRRLAGNPIGAGRESSNGLHLEGSQGKKMGSGISNTTEVKEPATNSQDLASWAEENGISAKDLAEAYGGSLNIKSTQGAKGDDINAGLCKDVEIGKYIGIDCEMVGVGGDEDRSVLARVSIVNFHGTQVYDSFVRPKEFVTDWRTHVSGVSPKNMATARSFDEVQEAMAEILKDRILVGHAVRHDLDALMLGHPKRDIRDTSRFSGFRKFSAGKTPSLKKLAKEVLGVEIQEGQHSSIVDARTTMHLFRRYKSEFDVEHQQRFSSITPNSSAGGKKKKKKAKR